MWEEHKKRNKIIIYIRSLCWILIVNFSLSDDYILSFNMNIKRNHWVFNHILTIRSMIKPIKNFFFLLQGLFFFSFLFHFSRQLWPDGHTDERKHFFRCICKGRGIVTRIDPVGHRPFTFIIKMEIFVIYCLRIHLC